MTQPARRPSTATRRTGGSQPAPDEHAPTGEHDLVSDRDRDDRGSPDTRGEQWHGDHGELGDGREPRREPGGVQRTLEQMTDRARAAASNPGNAFARTPDMSKVVTAWFGMAGDMMKLQQQFFADIVGARHTGDRSTTQV